MKISKRQLRRIIKEEKANLQENKLVGSVGFGSNAERGRHLAEQPISGEQAKQMQIDQDFNPLFDSNHVYDLLFYDFADIEDGSAWVSDENFAKVEASVAAALAKLRKQFVGR
jgi:hypothetical protein